MTEKSEAASKSILGNLLYCSYDCLAQVEDCKFLGHLRRSKGKILNYSQMLWRVLYLLMWNFFTDSSGKLLEPEKVHGYYQEKKKYKVKTVNDFI